MPTYQYACTECGHAFEQFQSFTDDALTVCPACEGRLRKIFNAVGVVFKGSGFYRTDSRGAEPAANGSEKSPDKSTAKGPDKSADKGREKAATKSSETSSAPAKASSAA